MNFWHSVLRLLSRDIAMDLGTANTLLYTPGAGIVVNEPSVVAMDLETNAIISVGADAKLAQGRTPKRLRTVRPLRNGVIADFDVTSRMVTHFIRKAIGRVRLVRPSIVICVPTGITQVEKKAVIDAAESAGAVGIALLEEPMAAAIGAGLPIEEPRGTFVADIGGGTSEVAVITLSSIVTSASVRMAGDAMDEAIYRALRSEYRLEVGENTREQVKIRMGSALPGKSAVQQMAVAGKDLSFGTPKVVNVEAGVIAEALKEPVEEIVSAVMQTLEHTPPELSADIYETGLFMAGGGSLLAGLPELLSERIELPVQLTEDPLTTVLAGTATTMRDRKRYSDVFLQ